jgi:hypothetical protein
MNALNMPGFVAEESLPHASRIYSTSAWGGSDASRVVPQMRRVGETGPGYCARIANECTDACGPIDRGGCRDRCDDLFWDCMAGRASLGGIRL